MRQQLAVFRRATPRPRLRPVDRAFWTVLSPLTADIVALNERMAAENPLWSRRRIASELGKLGHNVSEDAVAKYMPKPARGPRQPPSTTWGTFVRAHLVGTIASDFLVVPTVTFNLLYVFFVLSLERRRILHVNVTAQPYAVWTAQQIVEAVGFDTTFVRLIRDRDGIYGAAFNARVKNLGIGQIKIAPRSPWQNGYAERSVGTLRRELLDHVRCSASGICCGWFDCPTSEGPRSEHGPCCRAEAPSWADWPGAAGIAAPAS